MLWAKSFEFSPEFSPNEGKVMQNYSKLCKKMCLRTRLHNHSKAIKNA